MLPDWPGALRQPRTRELWWRGVPGPVRAEAWRRAIGNELGLTPQTYAAARARAAAVPPFAASASSASHGDAHSSNGNGDRPTREQAWLRAIPRDAARALPGLGHFGVGQPLHAALVDLLSAYAFYRADVGHAAPTAAPAALLLLTLGAGAGAGPAAAFVALANLLNRPLPLAFATGDAAGMARAYDMVGEGLRVARPKLHARLFGRAEAGGLGVEPAELLEPMLRSLFLHRCGEAPAATRRPPPGSASSMPASRPSPQLASPRPPPSSSPSPSSAGPRTPPATLSTGLPLALVQRLWDIFLFDGDAGLARCAVGALAAAERALYGSRDEVRRVLGWRGAGFGVGFGDAGEGEEEEERVEAFVGVVREVGRRRREKGEGATREGR